MNRRKKFFLLDAVGEAIELVWLVEGMRLKDTLMEREKKSWSIFVVLFVFTSGTGWNWRARAEGCNSMQFDATGYDKSAFRPSTT